MSTNGCGGCGSVLCRCDEQGKGVHVPDIPGPRGQLCWQQQPFPSMVRCDRQRHGPDVAHTWELTAELADLRRQLAAIVETALYRLLIECRDELADAREQNEQLRVRLAELQGARKGVTT